MSTIGGKNARTRGPAQRGLVILDFYRGVPRARAWPRKRGERLPPKTKEQMEWFRQANLLAKYAAGDEQARARELTKGSPLLPLDIMLQAMRGRFIALTLEDGRKLYPVAARDDVSESIDAIAQTPGAMLVRGPDFWTLIPPGTPGQVLTWPTSGVIPEWAGVAPTGGNMAVSTLNAALTDSTSAASKGMAITPLVDLEIHNVIAGIAEQNGWKWKAQLWSATGTTLNTKLAETPEQTATATGDKNRAFPFSPSVTLSAGQDYVIMLVRTDGTGTDNNGLKRDTSGILPYPVELGYTFARYTTNDPQPSDTPASSLPNTEGTLNIIYTPST